MQQLLREHGLEKSVRAQSGGDVAVSSVAHMVYIDVQDIEKVAVTLPFIYSLGIFSAVSVGLEVHLWTYHEVVEALPSHGVTVHKAADLLSPGQYKQCLVAGFVATYVRIMKLDILFSTE